MENHNKDADVMKKNLIEMLKLKSIMTEIFKKLLEVLIIHLNWLNKISKHKKGQFRLSSVRDKEKRMKKMNTVS